MKFNILSKGIVLLAATFALSSCTEGIIISPTYDGGVVIKAKKKSPPTILSFDYSPKTTVSRNDVITFTVRAESRYENEYLQYSWKTSKGTLLSNSGTTVSWKPERQDGVLESGIATITVTVSDGNFSSDASANVFISSDGRISTNKSDYQYDSGWEYERDYGNDYPDTYLANGLIFIEDFEEGYLDDDWTVEYTGSSRNNYLTWKKADDPYHNNNRVALLTGPTNDVLADTCENEVLLTSQGVDLRRAKLPKLSFDSVNYSNPSSSVKLNVYWSSDGRTKKSLNVSFIPDKNWNKINVDLKNLLSDGGGTVGLLSIGAKICGNKNAFSGPVIDNIKIYDDAAR